MICDINFLCDVGLVLNSKNWKKKDMGLHPNIPDSFWKPITDYLERKSQNQPFTKVHWLSLKNKFV